MFGADFNFLESLNVYLDRTRINPTCSEGILPTILSRGDVIGTGVQELVAEECPTCGVLYAIPNLLREKALERRGPNGKSIFCPNDHSWHFTGKTEAERLREELAREKDYRARIAAQRDQGGGEPARGTIP